MRNVDSERVDILICDAKFRCLITRASDEPTSPIPINATQSNNGLPHLNSYSFKKFARLSTTARFASSVPTDILSALGNP